MFLCANFNCYLLGNSCSTTKINKYCEYNMKDVHKCEACHLNFIDLKYFYTHIYGRVSDSIHIIIGTY